MAVRAVWIGLVLSLACAGAASATETLHVYVIDVGHGDAILLDCGDWEALIDAGTDQKKSEEVRQRASTNLEAALRSSVTDSVLDLVVLTHWHEDHTSLLAQVFTQYSVVSAWYGCDTSAAAIMQAYTEGGLPKGFEQPEMRKVVPEEQLAEGGFVWSVLGPTGCAEGSADDREINNSSLVLVLQHDRTAFAFAGDQLEITSELPELSAPVSHLVLVAPHHGYTESAFTALYDHFSPDLDLVVFSTDAWPPFGADTLRSNHVPFLATSCSGLIHLASDGGSILISLDTLARAGADWVCSPLGEEDARPEAK